MSTTKKIIIITPRFLPSIGGVEKHVKQINFYLSKQNKVVVVTEKYKNELASVEVLNNVTIHRFTFPKIKYLGIFVIWVKLLTKFKLFYQADVIHIHDVYIWYLPIRILLFWKKNYITFHGWEGIWPIPKKSIFQKRIASILSSGSISVGRYVTEIYSIKTNSVVYGAVDHEGLHQLVPKKDLIIFIGRLSEDTGLQVFLDLLHNNKLFLRKYQIIFCGDGELRAKCEKFGTVTGFVSPGEYLGQAKLSIASGYLSVFESLYSKCYTIVISQNKIRRKIFRNTPFIGRVSIANSSKDLAKYINDFTKSNENRELSTSDNQIWASKFTWKKIYFQYKSLWRI
jgi:glycosyltransferase involved in cell wall biosynthesis